MASLIFNRALENWAKGSIDFDTDSFKVMLTTSSYTADKDAHDFRDDVTNEITGTGYTAGGAAVTVGVTRDDVNDRVDISLGGTSWTTSTLTARRAVYYKTRGGASSADEIICVIDFGADVSTTAGTFTLTASTLRIQN